MSKRLIVLVSPTVNPPWELSAGIAQLAGVGEAAGHHVVQRYAHITGFEHLMLKHGGVESSLALAAMRDPASDILTWYRAEKTLQRVSSGIKTRDRFSFERTNLNYVSAHNDGKIETALQALRNPEAHLWSSYFDEVEVPFARDARPDIYGISTNDRRSFISSIVLAKKIKDALPGTLVVLGGNFWARVMHAFHLPGFAGFFDACDCIVHSEGYQPLLELAETLDPKQASGVAWRKGDEVVVNPTTKKPTKFETLPSPIFDRTVRQLSPDFVPSIYSTRHCYRDCGFCDIPFLGRKESAGGAPSTMSPRRTVEHMIAIGASRYQFGDEMLPVGIQLRIGQALKDSGHPEITWSCYATAEKQLADPRVCAALAEAGCRQMQIGFETLSPETLAREDKGWNTPKNYGAILKNLTDVGIHAHVFIMVGTPGEPLSQALGWPAFLEEHGANISTVKHTRYQVARHARDVHNKNHAPWIKIQDDNRPLSPNRKFVYREPYSLKNVEAVLDVTEQACRKLPRYRATSAWPSWVNFGRYTPAELMSAAGQLPPELPVPNLSDSIEKVTAIIRKELKLSTFADVVAMSRIFLNKA